MPLRTNVEFLATPDAALAAGYRSCRRCRPDQVDVIDERVLAVIEGCRYLERSDEPFDTGTLASTLGYSERHFRRSFVQIVGVTVGAYARALKAERVRSALRDGSSVTDAIIEAGYGSSRAFYEHGANRLGMSPSRYRDGGRGEHVRFTSIETPLATIVVASTAQGVCSLQLGHDEKLLCSLLADEFANATLERDDEGLEKVAEVIVGAMRGDTDLSELPVDLVGTAFQIRVWEALRRIPKGETRTYSQVADDIGAPRAVRAVASACAQNRLALTVPCHRVIRRDGTLGGYRWGLDLKKALLEAESSQ
jgi:AraC family transcriptional regulator of adaptative response/methylated-DNA-[protein]-cysteine methyltransferase